MLNLTIVIKNEILKIYEKLENFSLSSAPFMHVERGNLVNIFTKKINKQTNKHKNKTIQNKKELLHKYLACLYLCIFETESNYGSNNLQFHIFKKKMKNPRENMTYHLSTPTYRVG